MAKIMTEHVASYFYDKSAEYCLGEVFEQIIQKQLLNSMRYK